MRRALAITAMAFLGGSAVVAPAHAVIPQACPAFSWTTLGTAGGPAPTPERSEPANLLEAAGQFLLVDTGDGAVSQMAKAGVILGQVRTVFISHHHLDHTGGLAAVIGLRWMNQLPDVMTVYGPPGTKQMVAGLLDSMAPQARIGFGLGRLPPAPSESVRVIEVRGGQTVRIDGLTVTIAANSHFDHEGPTEPDAAQSLSYRFQLDRRSITFTGDTGPSKAVNLLAKGSDLLVSEVIDLERLMTEIRSRRTDAPAALFSDMRQHLSTHHLTPQQIGALAADARVGRLVLTHFAIPPGPLAGSEKAIRGPIARQYKGPISLANDLSRFSVKCR